jgi:hypothetical protein
MLAGTLVDGLENLVGLLEEVRLEGGARLLAVPRAATLTPEASHEREEGDEATAGGVSHGTI